jgi:hypothetical protein
VVSDVVDVGTADDEGHESGWARSQTGLPLYMEQIGNSPSHCRPPGDPHG